MRKLFLLTVCVFVSGYTQPMRYVSVFRNSGYYHCFTLDVNGKRVYAEKRKYAGNGAAGLFIGKFPLKQGVISIDLKICEKDTSFKYMLCAKTAIL